jgi:hypothetical protein
MTKAKTRRRVDEWVDAILYESGLPATGRLVAIVMARFMDWETLGNAWPGPALLAELTGLHQSTVKEWLGRLCDAGWLEQTHRGGSDKGQNRERSRYRGTFGPVALDDGSSGTDPSSPAGRPVVVGAATRRPGRGDPSSRTTETISKTTVKDRGQGDGSARRANRARPKGSPGLYSALHGRGENEAEIYEIVNGRPVKVK